MPFISIQKPTADNHWLPSANPIVFSISTTNPATPNNFIIDVRINGVNRASLKYPVYNNPINVDLNKIVNDYLIDNFANDNILSGSNTLIYQAREALSLSIKVTEEYWDSNSNQWFYDFKNAVTTKDIYVWRAGAEFEQSRRVWEYENDFQNDSYTNYYPYHPKFLGPKVEGFDYISEVETIYLKANSSFFHSTYKVSMDTVRTVSFFTYGYSPIYGTITDRYEVWCYDNNFNRTKTFYWDNPDANGYALNSYQKKISQLPCSPANLNQMPWTSITLHSGTLNYIDSSEDKYYVVFTHEGWAVNNTAEWGIRAIPFEIVCNQYDTYDILYKTREGGWWQIRADKKSFKETTVNTSVMYNTWGIGAMQPLPNSKRFKQTMHTDADGTITVNTDWLNSQYFIDEIEDMIVSPQIFLVKEGATPQYIPVVLKDTTHKIWNKNQEKLIQYEFEFEEAYKKTTLV